MVQLQSTAGNLSPRSSSGLAHKHNKPISSAARILDGFMAVKVDKPKGFMQNFR